MSVWDNWILTADDRAQYDSLFQMLKPVGGYIIGTQAKGFFLQSGLSQIVLGHIWALADTDADGRMDKNEFSIAMFLINKVASGAPLPPTLPNGLKFGLRPASVTSPEALDSLKFSSLSLVAVTKESTSSNSIYNDWMIPSSSRQNYMVVFNRHDRSKRGYLTGSEARNLLMASRLPREILAHIWNLSDLDKDGNLNSDEFCIAAFLIEKAISGVRLPDHLPAGLIPNSSQQYTAAVTSSNQSSPKNGKDGESDNKTLVLSFEDKRRENFRQGQLELDKRKTELAKKMQQEEELRLENARLENEKQQKLLLVKEQQQAVEAEKQAERARQIEAQREQRRRQAVEARTHVTRAAERQHHIENERLRTEAFTKERNHLQASLEQANAHRASLLESASVQENRLRDLDSRLSVAQTEVDSHKAVINQMRNKRDTYERDIRELTEQIEAAKAELTRCQREKEQLNLRMASGVDVNPILEQLKTLQASRNARNVNIEQLRHQLNALDQKMTDQGHQLATKRNKADELERRISDIMLATVDLRHNIKQKVRAFQQKRMCNGGSNTKSDNQVDTNNPAEVYEAMYKFDARHPDELSFVIGDVIKVFPSAPVRVGQGWLFGQLDDNTGLFPEAYVKKKVDGRIDPFDPFGVHKVTTSSDKTLTQASPSMSNAQTGSTPIVDTNEKPLFSCVTLYPYESNVTGDLNLIVGDLIHVYAIKADWWEGVCERTKLRGLFPANYVRKIDSEATVLEDEKANETIDCELKEKLATERDSVTVTSTVNNQSVTVTPDSTFPQSVLDSSSHFTNGVIVCTTPEFAKVIAPYKANSSVELSLQPGSVVQLRKRSPKGWWEGELQQRGRGRQIGWFPADFVRVITPISTNGKSNDQNVISVTDDSQQEPLGCIIEKSSNDLTTSKDSTSKDVTTSVSSPLKPINGSLDTNASSKPATVELMQTIFSYKAAHADELTFDEGAIITVLGRDEPEWWRGRLQGSGVEGLFPVNYVRPYNPLPTNPATKDTLNEKQANLETSNNSSSLTPQIEHDHVIREFIRTELAYKCSLIEVKSVFYDPIAKSALLSREQLNSIFPFWDQLIYISTSFHHDLEQRFRISPSDITFPSIIDIIVNYISGMRIYRDYCVKQRDAVCKLDQLLSASVELKDFILHCQSCTKIKLPLSSYLLKPVQRIALYKLLLWKMCNATGAGLVFHQEAMKEAFEIISHLLDAIDAAVGAGIGSQLCAWLGPRLLINTETKSLNWLLQSTNKVSQNDIPELIHYGSLYKAKTNREFVCFLFTTVLLLTLPNYETNGRPFTLPPSIDSGDRKVCFTLYRQPLMLDKIAIVKMNTRSNSNSTVLDAIMATDHSLSDSDRSRSISTSILSCCTNVNICGTLSGHNMRTASTHPLNYDHHTSVSPVFGIFNKDNLIRPIISLRAPTKQSGDRWISILKNAICRAQNPTSLNGPFLFCDYDDPNNLYITITSVRTMNNLCKQSILYFESLMNGQPRKFCHIHTNQTTPHGGPLLPSFSFYIPPGLQHDLIITVYSSMPFTTENRLGCCKFKNRDLFPPDTPYKIAAPTQSSYSTGFTRSIHIESINPLDVDLFIQWRL